MAFVSVVSLARADVLVNTFSNIDDGYGSWPLVIASTQFIARPFNVTGTYQLSEIDVPLQMNHSATFLVTVRRDDNGGVPGSLVESISVFSPIVVELEIHHLAAHSILTTGSYFITVEPADATSAGGWHIVNDGGLHSVLWWSSIGGTGWRQDVEKDMALAVYADPVPEPKSWFALGLGALLVSRRQRRGLKTISL